MKAQANSGRRRFHCKLLDQSTYTAEIDVTEQLFCWQYQFSFISLRQWAIYAPIIIQNNQANRFNVLLVVTKFVVLAGSRFLLER